MDLEQPPDSCERTGASVLWLTCEGQIDVWELFCVNLIPDAPCFSAVHSALSHSSRVLEKRHVTRSTVLEMLKLINGSGASVRGSGVVWSDVRITCRCQRGKVLKYEWHAGHRWHD